MTSEDLEQKLHTAAIEARKHSYSPYSKFPVGSALKFKEDDRIYSGCNIENASYGGCLCAERVAITKGLSEIGKKTIQVILIVTASPEGDNPCGLCLQVIQEFSDSDTQIIIANTDKIFQRKTVKDFLPYAFSSENLPS